MLLSTAYFRRYSMRSLRNEARKVTLKSPAIRIMMRNKIAS